MGASGRKSVLTDCHHTQIIASEKKRVQGGWPTPSPADPHTFTAAQRADRAKERGKYPAYFGCNDYTTTMNFQYFQ